MKQFLEFLEKHKTFIKKIIVFIIAYVVLVVINSEPLTLFFNEIFGEYITMGIKALTPTILLTCEV